MIKHLITVLIFFSITINSHASGRLLIVGGALDPENEIVLKKFVDETFLENKQLIGIIPVASGAPVKSANDFKNTLIKYGVVSSNILIFKLAVKDDASTPEDESLWRNNIEKPETSDQLNRCTALWFTGGDQSRITELFYDANLLPTNALKTIKKKYAEGILIGGTSAGAAMMSDPMIAGGDSFGALMNGVTNVYTNIDAQEQGQLVMYKGLGFFEEGIVDQHFDRKSRLGRLIVAVQHSDQQYGFGIDENTAFFYDSNSRQITVFGVGYLTIVQSGTQQKSLNQFPVHMNDIELSILGNSDQYHMVSKTFQINPAKKITNGNEYFSVNEPVVSGILSPNNSYPEGLFYLLTDNKSAKHLTSYLFMEPGNGFELVFKKDQNTYGYYGSINGLESYSALRIKLDIKPVKITIKPL